MAIDKTGLKYFGLGYNKKKSFFENSCKFLIIGCLFCVFDIILLRNRGAAIIGTLVPLEALSGQLPKSGCCSARCLSCWPLGSCCPKGVLCQPSAKMLSALAHLVFSSQSCGVLLQVRCKHALIQRELGPVGVPETKPKKLKMK